MTNMGIKTSSQIIALHFPDEIAAQQLRYLRDDALKETDVWALSDRTMTAEQTAYRQALRDITDQAGFPTDITWPTKPE